MLPICRWCACLAALLVFHAATTRAEDDDKARLFNTFFMDGDRVTWYLVFRSDRTFDLISPEGRKTTGNFVASNKEVYFAGRHFSFKFDGTNVTFSPTEKDGAGDSVSSELPVRGKGSKLKFLSTQNWQKAGKDATLPQVRVPDEPKPLPQPPPPVALGRVGSVAGIYGIPAGAGEHTLKLLDGGTFEYISTAGAKANGTYAYVNGELTLDSGFHRRHLAVAEALGGVQVSRRDTDVLKTGDPLGEMPPQERTPLLIKRRGNVAPRESAVDPLPTPAPLPDVKPVPEPPKPVAEVGREIPRPPVEQPRPVVETPKPPPAVPAGPMLEAPKSLAAIAGTYQYRPNPLVTETWVLKADGAFDYSDSNGAKVSGAAKLEGGVLKLTSGEVERSFLATTEAQGALTLTRTNEDNPKISNDLATMSPSVLKAAKYEKK